MTLQPSDELSPNVLVQAKDILDQSPSPQDEGAFLINLFHKPQVSCFLAQIRKGLNPHRHLTHDESIFVLEGEGHVFINGRRREIAPGVVMHMQRGNVHGVQVAPGGRLVFICFFTPEMREMDRVFVDVTDPSQAYSQ